MFPSGGNPFDSGGNPFGGGGFGAEPPMNGSFGFLSGEDDALIGDVFRVNHDEEVIGIGLHFCGKFKE